MSDPHKDPTRRCMPLAEWPASDQLAWLDASQVKPLLDDPGLAAHWRPQTKRWTVAAYGRFLTFLDLRGWLDPHLGPANRLSLERLRAYVEELRGQVTPATLAGRIRGLAEALRVMTPGVEYPYLKRARYALKARARPSRNKRARLVSTPELLQLGLKLMQRAEAATAAREVWQAGDHRDGLTIVLLAMRPIRLSNLAAMRIGQHLFKDGDDYHLAFDGEETKNHRPYKLPLPAQLTPYIDHYLAHYRPILLGSRSDDHVWMSARHMPMGAGVLYGQIIKRTTDEFGRSVNPHLFRDAAVTMLGEEDPEKVWLSMTVLHQADPRTADKHYNHARDGAAVRQYQDVITAQRRAAAHPTRRRAVSR